MCLIEGSVFAHYKRKANKFLRKWKTTTICQTHYGYSILGQHMVFGNTTVLHQKISNEGLIFAVVLPPPPNLFLMLNTHDLKESLPETRV